MLLYILLRGFSSLCSTDRYRTFDAIYYIEGDRQRASDVAIDLREMDRELLMLQDSPLRNFSSFGAVDAWVDDLSSFGEIGWMDERDCLNVLRHVSWSLAPLRFLFPCFLICVEYHAMSASTKDRNHYVMGHNSFYISLFKRWEITI